MDANRLGQGEKIAGIAAVILFLDMFLIDWFGFGGSVDTIAGFDVGADLNAWQAFGFIDIILLLTIGAAIAVAVMAANASDVNLPVAGSALVAGLGIFSTILILYRIIDTPFGGGRELGVFIGLLAAAGIAYGGWTAMQEEGTSFGDQADRFQGGDGPDAGSGGGQAPPPPPAR